MLTTSPTLLERLRGTADEADWRRFVQLYTPLLFDWARRAGESEHDASDLVQEVFVVLVQTLPSFRYDRQGGNFRSWLRTLMLNKLRDRKRRHARLKKALAHCPPEVEVPDSAASFWETEFQQEVTRRALKLMQAEFSATTWKACWETMVRGRPAGDVARELDMTENAVYIAKCRVLRRLRQEFDGLLD